MFQVCPSLTRLPNGETGHAMQARAVTALEALCAAQPSETIAIFSHGDIIKALLAFYAGMPLDHFQRIAIAPASISIVRTGLPFPRLVSLNYVGRLNNLRNE
jgi:probable phosphoglycerate mutase